MLNINYLSYYVPENKITIKEILDKVDNKAIPKDFENDKEELLEFFDRFVGIKNIGIENDQNEKRLIDNAITLLLKENKIDVNEIDLILDFSSQEFFYLRNCGHYIKHKFGITNADTIHFSGNQCANLDIALTYCAKLIETGFKKKILLCGGNMISDINNRIADSFSIIGDGYGAMIVKPGKSKLKLIDSEILTIGDLYQEEDSNDQTTLISDMYVKCLGKLFTRHDKNAIKKILIPNGYPVLLTQCLNYVGFDSSLIYNNNIDKGHLTYLDSLINLKDFIDENNNFDGNILSISISWSGTVVALIYKHSSSETN